MQCWLFSHVAAAQARAVRVILIDKCPEEWSGGNNYFTSGAFRTVHGGTNDSRPIANNVTDDLAKLIDLDAYTVEDFRHDINRITSGRALFEKLDQEGKYI